MLYPESAVTADPSQLVQLDAASSAVVSSAPLADAAGKFLSGWTGMPLAALMVELGEPAWRGKQMAEAIYRQRVTGD
jgi:hypothetical protein